MRRNRNALDPHRRLRKLETIETQSEPSRHRKETIDHYIVSVAHPTVLQPLGLDVARVNGNADRTQLRFCRNGCMKMEHSSIWSWLSNRPASGHRRHRPRNTAGLTVRRVDCADHRGDGRFAGLRNGVTPQVGADQDDLSAGVDNAALRLYRLPRGVRQRSKLGFV